LPASVATAIALELGAPQRRLLGVPAAIETVPLRPAASGWPPGRMSRAVVLAEKPWPPAPCEVMPSSSNRNDSETSIGTARPASALTFAGAPPALGDTTISSLPVASLGLRVASPTYATLMPRPARWSITIWSAGFGAPAPPTSSTSWARAGLEQGPPRRARVLRKAAREGSSATWSGRASTGRVGLLAEGNGRDPDGRLLPSLPHNEARRRGSLPC
jgi:hypothetical protein